MKLTQEMLTTGLRMLDGADRTSAIRDLSEISMIADRLRVALESGGEPTATETLDARRLTTLSCEMSARVHALHATYQASRLYTGEEDT